MRVSVSPATVILALLFTAVQIQALYINVPINSDTTVSLAKRCKTHAIGFTGVLANFGPLANNTLYTVLMELREEAQ
ncbi:hypothetical protein BC938DRAFT_472882 [Jimgerdemannia flammicorona]|uniref:Uncharacterized protein n=1 Tax=Jimgerdemannia flammicorona TaxID=994334 RepID=A0A433QTN6_9FUNG|nr:hypothetical protein BC938DRAFT_472882 [Jimgerdemannia flammicorona]